MALVRLFTLPSRQLADVNLDISDLEIGQPVSGWLVGSGVVNIDDHPGLEVELLQAKSGLVVWESPNGETLAAIIDSGDLDHQLRQVHLVLIGTSGIAHNYPWEIAPKSYVHAEAFDVFREIFDYIQGEPKADLGIQVDDTISGVTVGEPERDVSFTTESGQEVDFTAGPWKLEPWSDDDLSARLVELIDTVGGEWREESTPSDTAQGAPSVRIRLWDQRSPSTTRHHLHFEIGDNLHDPEITSDTGEPHRVRIIGDGSGSTAPIGQADNFDAPGARWVHTEADNSVTTKRAADQRADDVLKQMMTNQHELTQATVNDSNSAPFSQWGVGDIIHVKGETALATVDHWSRITKLTHQPDKQRRVIRLERVELSGG